MAAHRLAPPAALAVVALAGAPALAQCPLPIPLNHGGVAIDSGRAIGASRSTSPLGVVIHEKTPLGWELAGRFPIGDIAIFHAIEVAVDGDRAIAGLAEASGANWLSGRAFLFQRSAGGWFATELGSPQTLDFFGAAVDVDGDVAVVLAAHDEPYGDGLGRVHVFEFDGVAWNETAQIPHLGRALAVDGDVIALGDELQFDGVVDVWRRTSGVWGWDDRLTALSPGLARFGASVAVDGDRVLVGAAWTPGSNPGPGFVDVFERQAAGYYLRTQRFSSPAPAPLDEFGRSVALSGSTLLVGAPGTALGEGCVHRFEHDGAAFVPAGLVLGDGLQDGFGYRVAVDGSDAAVGYTWGPSVHYRLGFAALQAYCPTTPNSTGAPAVLEVAGCDSLAGASLRLVASALPPGSAGMFLAGAGADQQPFGDGYRCVAAPTYRLGAGIADALGSLVHDVDFDVQPGTLFAAGSTWRFQALHRDAASAGAGFNLSNALAVRIAP